MRNRARAALAALAIIVSAGAGVAIGAGPASAHHTNVSGTSTCINPETKQSTVTWSVTNPDEDWQPGGPAQLQNNRGVTLTPNPLDKGATATAVEVVTWGNGSTNIAIQVTATFSNGQKPKNNAVVMRPRDCKPDQPADKVEFGEWQDGAGDCETKMVAQTRTKTVTPFVYDAQSNTWVPGTSTVTEESQTRPMTDAELDACAGPQPEDKVEHGEWIDGEWKCGDTTVEQKRTVTTTPYVLVDHVWVEGEPVVTEETQTRELSGDEQYPCPTEPPVTTTNPPVVTTQPPVTTTEPPATTTTPPATDAPSVANPSATGSVICVPNSGGVFRGQAKNTGTGNARAVFTAFTDGNQVSEFTLLPGEEKSFQYTWPLNSGTHTVQIDMHNGTDPQSWVVGTDCAPLSTDVGTPPAPATADPAPSSAPELPVTGGNTSGFVYAALTLLGLGALATVVVRRRKINVG